jgi:Mn2+/Fe2+ NRAMP family transporter
VLAFPVMVMMMLMSQNPKIMGEFVLPGYLRIWGWAGTLVMGAASLIFLTQSI